MLLSKLLPNNKFHIIVPFNWGGTIAALWNVYNFLKDKEGYVAHFEEDFGPSNNKLLIDSIKLSNMQSTEALYKMGQVRWYKRPKKDSMYVVALDPSAGTGGDNSAIQVIELPSMMQVAEWCHNKTPIEGQVKTMMEILQEIQQYEAKEIYWSVENNSIGEAALVVIRDTGEENFPGTFLHDPVKVQGRKGRKGFHTSSKTKIEGCIQIKRYIENELRKIFDLKGVPLQLEISES